MRKQAARDGDRTTTGGRVQAWHGANFTSHGQRVTFHGSLASCGECKGMYPVIASYDGWHCNGRKMLIQNDAVACPCGKNRVIALGTNIFIELNSRGNAIAARSSSGGSPSSFATSLAKPYDERFLLIDAATGEPLIRHRYRIVTDSGRTLEGVTDYSGRTQRITTERAERFRLDV